MKNFLSIRLFLLAAMLCSVTVANAQLDPVTVEEPAGAALVESLRHGGLVLAVRHADTGGMACDRTYRIGEREGQRNISPVGEEQSRRLGEAIRALDIPLELPVLTGPVFRARDTAELAFGADNVEVTHSLLADDYAGGRVGWVIAEHRHLMNEPPLGGHNKVLVGHRTPILLALDGRVSGLVFPEGAAIVLRPAAEQPEILGILNFAPVPNPGIDRC